MEFSQNQKNEITYLNFARILAVFAVLLLHTICTPLVFCQNLYSSSELFFVRLSRNLLNWCVPVFVMITGVLFLNPEKEVPYKKIFTKYLRRFFLVLLSFGTLFALMEIVFTEKRFSPIQLLSAFRSVCLGKSWDHLWYIYMTIGLYIFIPVLKTFVNNVDDKMLYYSLLVTFVISSAIPYVNQFLDFNNDFPCFSIYFFYMGLGYAIHFKKAELKNWQAVLILIMYTAYLCLIQLNSFSFWKIMQL